MSNNPWENTQKQLASAAEKINLNPARLPLRHTRKWVSSITFSKLKYELC